MKLLFVSNLFPDNDQPVRGLDNATLLRSLRDHKGYLIRVLSPRPQLFPFFHLGLKPRSDDEFTSPVYSPVGYIPKFGSRWNARIMYNGLRKQFHQTIEQFQPDAVLCSWLFPDGCALARLCQETGLPLTLITQGSDTHQYLSDPVRKAQIVTAANLADTVICRSGDLATKLASAGVEEKKLKTVYNGINESIFHPIPTKEARQKIGISEDHPLLLFVGNLLPIKDPHFLIRSHAELNSRRISKGKKPAHLQLIGEGPLRESIASLAKQLGTHEQVTLLGRCTPEEVALRMNASNALCMSSRNEGFPNVILEALACGLRIVSTDVGGISEKVDSPTIGWLSPLDKMDSYVQNLERAIACDGKNQPTSGLNWQAAADAYDQILQKSLSSQLLQGS